MRLRGRTQLFAQAWALVGALALCRASAGAEPGAAAPGVVEPLAVPDARAPAATADPSLARLRLLHRRLELVTLGSFIVTGVLGGIVATNQTSSIHTGRCDMGDPLFGSYGCGSLSTVHGISAVSSLALYASTTTMELAIPGVPAPEKIARHATSYRALTYFHRGVVVVQPILGILARFPDVIGIDDGAHQRSFAKATRTVHEGLGITILAAYTATIVLSW